MTKEACLKQDNLGLSEQRSKIKWFRKKWHKSLRKNFVFPINWLTRHKMHISYRNHQKLAAIVIRHRLWLYVINTFNLWPCTIYCHPRWALTTSVKAIFHGQSSVCRTFIQTENRSIQSSRHIYISWVESNGVACAQLTFQMLTLPVPVLQLTGRLMSDPGTSKSRAFRMTSKVEGSSPSVSQYMFCLINFICDQQTLRLVHGGLTCSLTIKVFF